MKIDLRDLREQKITLTEEVNIENFPVGIHYSLKKVHPFLLEVTLTDELETVGVHLGATVKVTLECAYTLIHFESELVLDEYFCLTSIAENGEEELDDCYYEQGPIVDLTPYILILIVSNIPLKVVAPGAKRPENVLSEEDYANGSGNRPFARDDELDALYDELDD